MAQGELVVQLRTAAVGPAGVLRGRLLGGMARHAGPLASVVRAFLRGAGSVIPRTGAIVRVGLDGRFSAPHGFSAGPER